MTHRHVSLLFFQGVSIFYRDSTGEYQTKSFVETADVILKSYSSDIIEAYLDAGNGL